jgi:hypothetical protein
MHIHSRRKVRFITEEIGRKEGSDAHKLKLEMVEKKWMLCRTYAVSGPCRKRHVAVRMSAYAVVREKPIRVESFGIRKMFRSSVQVVGQYNYVSAGGNDVITCRNK